MNRLGPGGLLVRFALSILLCYAPPVVSYYLLGASGPLGALLVYATAVEAAFLAKRLAPRSLVPQLLIGVVVAAGAAALLIALDITPASAFLAWFRLVQSGQGGGTVAFMFATDFAFFSSLFAGMALAGSPWTSLLGFLFSGLFLSGVILESTLMTLCAAGALIAFFGYSALRQVSRGRTALAVPAIEVVALACLLALLFTPLKLRNGFVDALLSIDMKTPVARIFPGFPFLYNVPGYGYSFSRSDLGGRPALTSRPVFEVSAAPGETIYLRTAVYNTYTGQGWALSTEAEEAARAAAPKDVARGFTIAQAAAPAPSSTLSAGLPAIRVEVLIDFFGSLPNTLDTVAIRPLVGLIPPLSYGSRATGYVLSVPVEKGFRLVDERGGATRKEGRGRAIDRAEYLQTGPVPSELSMLARRLRRPSPQATVAAIQRYLAANYRYSLDTKRFPAKTNAVADFLFHSRTGYCVQFASAFTLLARLDGIPARYVTGFLVNLPAHSAKEVVTGLSAHSWSEVWFEDRGWMTVEATPPMMSSSLEDPRYYRHFNPTDSAFTERQLQAIMGARVPPPSPPPARRPSLPVTALGLGAAALALLALLFRAAVLLLLPRPLKLRRLVRKILRRTLSMSAPRPERAGWRRWAAEVGRVAGRTASLDRAASLILELSFGNRPAGRRELRFIRSLHRTLRRAGRRTRASHA